MSLNNKFLLYTLKDNYQDILSGWYDNQFLNIDNDIWQIAGLDSLNEATAKSNFLIPLLNMLIEYIKTGENTYLYGYLDERLRYAPHQSSQAKRVEFFSLLLKKDLQTIEKFAEKDIANIQQSFLHIHKSLLIEHKNPVRVLALGDCLMNELRVFVPSALTKDDINVDFRCVYFSALMGKDVDFTSIDTHINEFKPEVIGLSLLSYDALPIYSMLLKELNELSVSEIEARISLIVEILTSFVLKIREVTDATLLLHGVSGIPLGKYRRRIAFIPSFSRKKAKLLSILNQRILECSNATINCLFIDEFKVGKTHGFKHSNSQIFPRKHIQNGMLHTNWFGYYLSEQYTSIIKNLNQVKQCKVLMLDFDNTLWEGVMGDGEVHHYVDRQHLLKRLKDSGILLVSVSKNSYENIRWDEMVLKPEDFVLHKINWDLKVISISTAVEEINIGLDTAIFIDDNPVELDLIQSQLPQVKCLDATQKRTWDVLELMHQLPITKETEESKKRTLMYQEAFERKKLTNSHSFNYEKMMGTLQLELKFTKAPLKEISRIHELVSRTNQFNTTTKRYSKDELTNFIKKTDTDVFIGSLSDKFGRLGIVLVVIAIKKNSVVILDSFVMSCRAMGFGLEKKVISLLVNEYEGVADSLIGEFVATDRNTPCSSLYSEAGFEAISEQWVLDSDKFTQIAKIPWITVSE
jgi:FkbH-like protein